MTKATAEHLRVIEGGGEPPERAPSEPPPDPLIGRTIDGRYRVERVLGEGGMGIVYQARHVVLNRPHAIKVLRSDVSKDEEIITRFRQEAQSATAIGSEHIIDISDFGTLPDGSTYFVMEFLDGIDLANAMEREKPMNQARAVHIVKQLCRALGAAHRGNIVHRDLKPDNVYLVARHGDSNFVKVLDFGIAKVGSGTKRLTKAGQVFGTPHYMSPEQCAGQGIDHRTDIYALGVILYEMTTGRVPFDADSLMGILTKQMYEAPAPPSTLGLTEVFPGGLEAVILKALEKNPDERYQTMDEMSADLELIEVGEIPRASIDHERRLRAALPRDTVNDLDRPRRVPLVWLAIGAIAVLLVGFGTTAAVLIAAGGPDAVVQESIDPPPTVGTPEIGSQPEVPVAVEEPLPENMEASGSRETRNVRITTDPEGVEVLLNGSIVGNTPLDVPKPEGDESLEVTLRLARYEEQVIRITSFTQEQVRVTLEPVRRGRDREIVRTPMVNAMTAQIEMSPVVAPPLETPMIETPPDMRTRVPQSEVLDPWAR
jgi:eukaryotic-like serine/threonine-protein kinase